MSRDVTEFVEAIAERLAPRVAEVASTLYGHILTDLDTYLVDNTVFNLTSKLDTAKREAEALRETAKVEKAYHMETATRYATTGLLLLRMTEVCREVQASLTDPALNAKLGLLIERVEKWGREIETEGRKSPQSSGLLRDHIHAIRQMVASGSGPLKDGRTSHDNARQSDGEHVASFRWSHDAELHLRLVNNITAILDELHAQEARAEVAEETVKYWRERALAAEAKTHRLTRACRKAKLTFLQYGAHHDAKPDPEKAKRNYDLAEEMKLALDGPEEEKPVG